MKSITYSEDQLLPISAIAHFCYCERRYALIHLEQLWAENRFTVEGEILHERVHAEHHESRKYFRQEYSMAVRSLAWGLIGKCDLVELWLNKDGSRQKVSPVEFKRGRKKESDVDRVQLCAQALCLEEMLGVTIESGQFYYWQEHRRSDVLIDQALREVTIGLLERIRALQDSGQTPQAEYEKRKCDNCSLVDSCMPKSTNARAKQVERFIQNNLHLIKEL
ncbi:CRISPR-associated protein Cas4 [Candidatus Termititenax aidoneus]|uniref:CRISPR-associated exonuclease Cas4 n=1 Tax=Termititenax aidoneus TaxID=2218524 RepID=A0A388TA79_TERA1|nr:CRISPR-associated protein Cas4 [Candidatus Termititenax aidoneus]